MSQAFYNENDPKAAAWLRELIAQGHIAPGIVDERSISDISPTDLNGFTQCHFFAGIAGWSLALRLAGVPDSFPVWSGSCPCQPFSAAGKQEGAKDERHLWPSFARHIEAQQPSVVFGEQVASKAGRDWLDGIFTDLEDMGYRPAGADLCAASVGAPHIRQRLYWVADTEHAERWPIHFDREHEFDRKNEGREEAHGQPGTRREVRAVADSDSSGPFPRTHGGVYRGEAGAGSRDVESQRYGHVGRMDDGLGVGRQSSGHDHGENERLLSSSAGILSRLGDTGCDGLRISGGTDTNELTESGHWEIFELLACLDGKARRIEPGTFPLAHGIPERVGLLRGYGNAIVPQAAAIFIRAYFEARAVR